MAYSLSCVSQAPIGRDTIRKSRLGWNSSFDSGVVRYPVLCSWVSVAMALYNEGTSSMALPVSGLGVGPMIYGEVASENTWRRFWMSATAERIVR